MCLLVVPWVSFNRFTSICVIDRRQSCVTHPGAALRSGGCSLVSLGGLVILHLLPDAVHLALQHVEPAVNVAGDADRTAEVSMAASPSSEGSYRLAASQHACTTRCCSHEYHALLEACCQRLSYDSHQLEHYDHPCFASIGLPNCMQHGLDFGTDIAGSSHSPLLSSCDMCVSQPLASRHAG